MKQYDRTAGCHNDDRWDGLEDGLYEVDEEAETQKSIEHVKAWREQRIRNNEHDENGTPYEVIYP